MWPEISTYSDSVEFPPHMLSNLWESMPSSMYMQPPPPPCPSLSLHSIEFIYPWIPVSHGFCSFRYWAWLVGWALAEFTTILLGGKSEHVRG